MSKINNGGPAFPAGAVRKSRPAHDPGADFRVTDVVEPRHAGMTLRDYFAAKAMQALVAARSEVFIDDKEGVEQGDETDDTQYITSRWLAIDAYCIADKMLKAREA